jgi:hypothetical protein
MAIVLDSGDRAPTPAFDGKPIGEREMTGVDVDDVEPRGKKTFREHRMAVWPGFGPKQITSALLGHLHAASSGADPIHAM